MEIVDFPRYKYLQIAKQLNGKLRRLPEYYEYCIVEDYEDKYEHFSTHAIQIGDFYYNLLEVNGTTELVSILLPAFYDVDRIIEFLEHFTFSFNQKDKKGYFAEHCYSIVEGKLFKGMPLVLGKRGKLKCYYNISNFHEITDSYEKSHIIVNTANAQEINPVQEQSQSESTPKIILNGMLLHTIPRIDFDLTKDMIISNGQVIVADYIDEYCNHIGFYSLADSVIPISYLLDKDATVHITLNKASDGSKTCNIEHSYHNDRILPINKDQQLDKDNCLIRKCPYTSNKLKDKYHELVRQRKSCHSCIGLRNPSVANKEFDSNEIGPWSTWKGDLDAKVVVVGQDWGDEATYISSEGRCNPTNTTNRRLVELLHSIGISVEKDKVFFTNAILCLKKGGLAAKTKKEWFDNCGSKFLKPLLEIIQPKIIITLGESAYKATVSAFNEKIMSFSDAVNQEEPHIIQSNSHNYKLFPVYHCGQLGLRNRKFELQIKDWERIKKCVDLMKA